MVLSQHQSHNSCLRFRDLDRPRHARQEIKKKTQWCLDVHASRALQDTINANAWVVLVHFLVPNFGRIFKDFLIHLY